MSKPVLDVKVQSGKYRVIMHKSGALEALRHGEPWRKLAGDNLVYALALEVESLRKQLIQANADKTKRQMMNEGAYYCDANLAKGSRG